MGQGVGVPGAAEGAAVGGRPGAGNRFCGCRGARSLVECVAGELRRVGAADAGAGDSEHPKGRSGRATKTRSGWPARRRIHHSTAAARPRPNRPEGASARHASCVARSGRPQLHRTRGECRIFPGLPVSAASRAPAATFPPAPHPPDAAGAGRVAGTRQGYRPTRREGTHRSVATHQNGRTRPPRTAVLPAVARGGGSPARGRHGAQQRGRRSATGRHRLRRSAGRAATHRGADGRSVAPSRYPTQPAAGDPGMVGRGGRSRSWTARIPPSQRRSGGDALVPADAARLLRRRAPAHPATVGLALRR